MTRLMADRLVLRRPSASDHKDALILLSTRRFVAGTRRLLLSIGIPLRRGVLVARTGARARIELGMGWTRGLIA